MGDLGQVIIKDREAPDLYLYTHWRGSQLREIVRSALKRRQRWNDGPYLARIIFCEMIKGEEKGETGFGISTTPCDGVTIKVDIAGQKVGTIPFDKFAA